jgi:hypothetical protein
VCVLIGTVIGDWGFVLFVLSPVRHVLCVIASFLSFLVDSVFGKDPGQWCANGPRFPEVVGSIVADAFSTLSGISVQ